MRTGYNIGGRGRGVAVYIKEAVHYEWKTNLEIIGLVCLGGAQDQKVLFGTFYVRHDLMKYVILL